MSRSGCSQINCISVHIHHWTKSVYEWLCPWADVYEEERPLRMFHCARDLMITRCNLMCPVGDFLLSCELKSLLRTELTYGKPLGQFKTKIWSRFCLFSLGQLFRHRNSKFGQQADSNPSTSPFLDLSACHWDCMKHLLRPFLCFL